MKKYLFSIFVALIVGFVMAKVFLEQYDSYQGIKFTSNSGEMVYFIKFNSYPSIQEMEKNTLSLTNYIYKKNVDVYDVYIGITNDYENLIKLNNYFSSLGYNTFTEEFLITNKEFLLELKNYDSILRSTEDTVVISSINSQILEKYEDLINGSKD